jgi:hypothetical protein
MTARSRHAFRRGAATATVRLRTPRTRLRTPRMRLRTRLRLRLDCDCDCDCDGEGRELRELREGPRRPRRRLQRDCERERGLRSPPNELLPLSPLRAHDWLHRCDRCDRCERGAGRDGRPERKGNEEGGGRDGSARGNRDRVDRPARSPCVGEDGVARSSSSEPLQSRWREPNGSLDAISARARFARGHRARRLLTQRSAGARPRVQRSGRRRRRQGRSRAASHPRAFQEPEKSRAKLRS